MTQQTVRPFDVTGWTAGELADPYPVYRRYREQDPVHRSASGPGGADTWYLFRDRDVTDALTSPHFGRNTRRSTGAGTPPPRMVPDGYDTLRTVVENWLVFLDPPRHTRLRALINKEFSPRVVAGLRPRIEQIADELLASMVGRPTIDLVDEFAAPFPILVISELLGVSPDDRGWFRDQVMNLREGIASRTGRRADGYALADAAAADLVTYFRVELDRRRSAAQDDLIALLVDAQARGEPLTDDELVANAIHLLIAGHETTTNLIAKAMLALLAHPAFAAALRSTPDLMPQAVDELLRYDAPVQMVTRWAERDQVIDGRDVRAGDKVVLVLGSANRDPARFADPDTLKIRPGPNRHCGFGSGIHFCLGAPLARLEAEIALRMLLDAFPGMARTDEPVPYAEDIVFHGPTRLVLKTGH
nr:RebP-like cytochrome P450 [uncultured bacterium]